MTLNKIFTLLALGATLMFVAAGCEEEATEETTETETEAEPEEAAEEAEEAIEEAAEGEAAEAQPQAGGEGEAAGGSVCDRAQRCCEAYVAEMNTLAAGSMNVETSCAGIAAARNMPGGAGDSTCTQTIAGFRQGLSASNRTVPADCAE